MPSPRPTAADEVLRLIKDSELSLSAIARQSGVRYQPLWKFVKGRKRGYDVSDAERVYQFFTGNPFIR